MAVLPAVQPKPPAKPVGLEVKVRPDKSLHIRWPSGRETPIATFRWRFATLNLKVLSSTHSIPPASLRWRSVQPSCLILSHVPRDQARVVKVVLRAVSEDGLLSEAVQKQVSWDAELTVEETISRFETTSCRV